MVFHREWRSPHRDQFIAHMRARSILTMLGNGNFHREQVAQLVLGEAA